MSIGVPPTLLPPQLSPDGKWIWDGHEWQPLPETTWEPDAAAVIPQAVAAAVAAVPVQPVVQPRPAEIRPQPAAFSYPVVDVPVVEAPVTPLWVEPAKSGLTIYMYAGAAAVVLVMLMMVLNSTNIIQLPWPSSSSSAAVRQSPTTPRSEYARADRFQNFFLAPSLLSIGHTLPNLQSACTGTLSPGCLTALNAAKEQVTVLISNLDHGNVPPCIAAGALRTKADFQSMADGLDLSLNGFQDNNGAEVYQGISHFAYVGRLLKPDVTALAAQKAHCSKATPA